MNDRFRKLTLGALLLLVSAYSLAVPVSYQFVATAMSGPLNGASSAGYFTFDDSVIPAGGGIVAQTGLLSSLAFTWLGVDYTADTVNTGFASFASIPGVFSISFGSNCSAVQCNVGVSDTFFITAFGTGTGLLAYNRGGVFGGGKTSRLERCEVVNCGRVAVPSPGSGALFAFALVAFAIGLAPRGCDPPSLTRHSRDCGNDEIGHVDRKI